MTTPQPPAYSYQVLLYAGHYVLCITDDFNSDNPSITVTNSAKHVLKKIQQDIELPQLIIYRDTQGEWDRLVINEAGVFVGFSPVFPGLEERPTALDDALQLLVTSQVDKCQGIM